MAARIHSITALTEVTGREAVQTTRLDDIDDLPRIDFLKIDIQGGELAAFRGGSRKLAHTLCVQTEVAFTPICRDQPLFADQDARLQSLGLRFCGFASARRSPFCGTPNHLCFTAQRRDIGQWIDADAACLRAFVALAPAAGQIPKAGPPQPGLLVPKTGKDRSAAEKCGFCPDELHLLLVVDVTIPDLDLTFAHAHDAAQDKPGHDRDDGEDQDQCGQAGGNAQSHQESRHHGADGEAKEDEAGDQHLQHAQRKTQDHPGPPGSGQGRQHLNPPVL